MTQFSYSQEYAELSKFYQLNNLTRLSEVCRLGETQQYKLQSNTKKPIIDIEKFLRAFLFFFSIANNLV